MVAMPDANATDGDPNSPFTYFVNTMPTAISDTTPSADSISMAPYPIGFASASLLSCLEVVPVATREWKPEHAPQATVINSAGNMGPIPVRQPRNAGNSNVAVPVKPEIRMPTIARIIMP